MKTSLFALIATAVFHLAACSGDPEIGASPRDGGGASTADGSATADTRRPDAGEAGAPASYTDPGRGEWEPVPRDRVAEVCRLDPELLDEIDRTLNLPWGIVRYGRLCHEFYPEGEAQMTEPQENFSATKTLGATVVGIAAYQTRELPRTGRKTGPLSDMDRVDHWLDSFDFNPDAHIAHVLGMVAYNESLAWEDKVFSYDATGEREINRLSDIVNAAIAQDPEHFGDNIEEFTQRFLFEPVGMRHSTWSDGAADKVFGFSWSSPLRDMMRLGLLLLNDGMWDGERLLDADWVYRMTHPSFEDSQLGYGYLTWLEARTDMPSNCMPSAVHADYPHGLSEATDCNGPTTDFDCSQEYDVGVWHANGLGGQLIIGMKGLDMVITIKDFGDHDGIGVAAVPPLLWPIVRPAVVALDPTYAGDDAAFCDAYGSNSYAPDLR